VFNKVPANLHVGVGMQSLGESVAINFVGPFAYDIDSHVQRIRDRIAAALAPPRTVFSGQIDDARVPRIAGTETNRKGKGKVGVGVDKSPSPPRLTLPEQSPLHDLSARAAAALVLDHLETAGHARAAALMRTQMVSRGWINGTPVPTPSMPTELDVPVSAYPSPGAAISSLLTLLGADGTPRMPTALLSSIDLSGLDPGVARRLKVYDFAAVALAAVEDDAMDVDEGEKSREEVEAEIAAEDKGGEEVAMDMDATSTSDSDIDDKHAAFLAAMRELALAAKNEAWPAPDLELLNTATSVVIGHAGAQRACEVLREARMRDLPEIARAVKRE